jgi:Transcriptional regulator PadR-like family
MREPTFLILTALTGSGPLHGYGIVQQVSARSGGRVTLLPGTLYTALDRLVAQGLVEHDRDEAVDGRLRRYYRLTGDGRTALGPAGFALANLAYAATVVLWGPPIAMSAPALLGHHLAEDHAGRHPLREWLGQPTFALFLLAGAMTAGAGLGIAALPHTQVPRAGSYPGTTTAPARRP